MTVPLPGQLGSQICPSCGGPYTVVCGCQDLLTDFRDLMSNELLANFDKGGRAAWREDSPYSLLAEVHDHAAKLHIAVRELERRRAGAAPRPLPWGDRSPESLVVEFGADTANMIVMLLDSLRLLGRATGPDDARGA